MIGIKKFKKRIAQLESEIQELKVRLVGCDHLENVERHRDILKSFDNIPNGVIYRSVRDLQTGILKFEYVSGVFEKMTGVSAEAALADVSNVFMNIHPDDLPRMMQAVNDSLDPLQNFEIEVRYFHPVTKKETWIQLSSYPHCEGNFIFAEGFVFDISDRKEIERKLALHTEKLEDLVQELAVAKEKAEDSDRLKSAFLANMSHEFRTPLSGIVGLLQFLNSEDFTPEERRDYINIIIDNGSYLEKLIDDIIDVSKIEAKQMKVHPVELQLNGMMNEVRMFFESYLKTKNKEDLTLILDDGEFIDHCVVCVDRVRLRQILNNLLSNAVKFTEAGYIRFGYRQLSPDMLEFFVEDTGIGMSPEQQKVVFERFGRAEYGNKRQYEGTGLGLAISRSLVQLMGGEIRVESNEGAGTTFYFTIPYLRCNCVQEL